MNMSTHAVRRGLAGVLATCALGGAAAAMTLPTATAAPAPCTAGGFATTASGVLGAAGGYLDTHPGANNVLTRAATQSAGEAQSSVRAYFVANPGEFNDLRNIVRPLSDQRNQCGVDVTPGQLSALVDALSA